MLLFLYNLLLPIALLITFSDLSAPDAQTRRIRPQFFATLWTLFEIVEGSFRRGRMDLDSRG